MKESWWGGGGVRPQSDKNHFFKAVPNENVESHFGNPMSGLCKNPGFSSKTQPSEFNWFKPGFNGFYGLNWGKLRFPLKIQNQRPKS